MRYTFLLLTLVALGAAVAPQQKQLAANQELLQKQQDVIDLLSQITQDQIPNPQLNHIGHTYNIVANADKYDNPVIVKYYGNIVNAGLVQPRGTAFSNSISQLRKEASILQQILLGAQNYQVFLNTAAYARVYVNEGQFLQAFSAAILQRPDTQGVILPPLYEVLPWYYFSSQVIQKAQIASALNNDVVIPVNQTTYVPHGEDQLSYFTNDIGLANYNAYVSLANNYMQWQLLARYQLNRLSNGLSPINEVDYINVEAPLESHLQHYNGLPFPDRPETLNLQQQSYQQQQLSQAVRTLEQRLIQAIDSGYVQTSQGLLYSLYQPQGLSILADLIQGSGRSVNPRYYGNLQAAARQLLGNAPHVQNVYDYTPSVMELPETSVRDPAFYQLLQKVIKLYNRYQQSLPAYQYNHLVVPGVTIKNVAVTPLSTFFSEYYVNFTQAMGYGSQQWQQQGQQQWQQQEQQQGQQQIHQQNHQASPRSTPNSSPRSTKSPPLPPDFEAGEDGDDSSGGGNSWREELQRRYQQENDFLAELRARNVNISQSERTSATSLNEQEQQERGDREEAEGGKDDENETDWSEAVKRWVNR
ncbi:hypothetical protein M0802_005847 [Mischocyttarus mexicanus]|nr:hypothetical protein M0802_005847 [Mischocyttarus mexicanus]